MAIAFDHCCFDREIPLPRDPDEDPTNCDLFAMALAYGNAWGCFGAAGFRRDIRKSAKRGSCLGSSASAGASARGMRGAEHEEKQPRLVEQNWHKCDRAEKNIGLCQAFNVLSILS